MTRFLKGRSTPALLVSIIALVAAVGGTAFAGPIAVTALSKNDKKAVTKIVKAYVKKTKVPRAARADAATNAGHASAADNATNAAHATAADTATTAGHAAAADKASSADHATSADSATSATSAGYTGTLPSGHSESGTWAAAAGAGSATAYANDGISFQQPLAAAIPASNVHLVGPASASCPGYGQAAPGHLCVYVNESSGGSFYGFIRPDIGGLNNGVSTVGVSIYYSVSANGATFADGSWTVTAP